ncbi:hypothetical protein [Corynebacterium freiburgense]|uniref:hypothetical protein n=1 Tax=Corynebacterium freiburgense TaxID=556548 RepID=UPI0003FE31BF|nr:hypothetical protein [Corynebacterium freiburgense]WJZ01754.1 hypothetical protein CFREI_02250 [Corynebacterium freiburgense]
MCKKALIIGLLLVSFGATACSSVQETSGSQSTVEESSVAASNPDRSFIGTGEEVDAPEGFDPLGTGKVYEGSYSVTAAQGSDLRPQYASIKGTAYFDLGDLQPLEDDLKVDVFVQQGGVSVIVPNGVPVKIQCAEASGEHGCKDQSFHEGGEGKTLTLVLDSKDGPVEVAELQH